MPTRKILDQVKGCVIYGDCFPNTKSTYPDIQAKHIRIGGLLLVDSRDANTPQGVTIPSELTEAEWAKWVSIEPNGVANHFDVTSDATGAPAPTPAQGKTGNSN
jgi:hypothetical protein